MAEGDKVRFATRRAKTSPGPNPETRTVWMPPNLLMPDPETPTAEKRHQTLPVWCGLGVVNSLRLLRMGPPVSWRRAGRLAAMLAASGGNSLLAGLERIAFGRAARRTDLAGPPVFVVGHWRSGTTLLHEWLARDPQFTAPTQYECAFPGHFRVSQAWLAPLTGWLLPHTRPMDNMAAGWDRPGEDEVALLLLTLHSPYLRAAFPNAPDWLSRFNNLEKALSAAELEAWRQALVGFLRRISLRRPRPILLKSPSHTGRVRLLRRMFPGARFIHIARNPHEVFASTRHLQRVLFRDNAFTDEPPRDLDEFVLSTYLDLYQGWHLQKALIPEAERYELRFEDLVADPVGALTQLYSHLGFSGADRIAEWLGPELASHRNYRRNEYVLTDDERRTVADRWGVAFRRYGYATGFETTAQASSS